MTRPLDKHLDPGELNALVSSAETGVPESGPPPAQDLAAALRHVESCHSCSRTLQVHRSVQREISRMPVSKPSPPGPDCLGEADWLDLAAGLLPAENTQALLKHAAQCGNCGPMLKNATEMLANEATPEEETQLASLPSAQPAWRGNMARALQQACSPDQPRNLEAEEAQTRGEAELQTQGATTKMESPRTSRDSQKVAGLSWLAWPRLAFVAAAVVVLAASGWLGYRALRPASVDQLLAEAYTEHRTLEVRIPGAKYAPMRVERGAGGSSLDKPASLLKAEALISENLRKAPNDPVWLQAKARADLLDGNYDSAIKTLQRALETNPDSASLLTDLGSAYFSRAESVDRPIDYGYAIESLSKSLAQSPDDPVALFNRALACEHMFLYAQAIDDWQHYLRIDPKGDWASEARRRLAALKDKLQQHDNSQQKPLLAPTKFSEAIEANPEGAIPKLDQRTELYLDTAVQTWLPQAYGDGPDQQRKEARHALEHLADILKTRHDDTWLSDFLQSPVSAAQTDGLRSVLASGAALKDGRYSLSVKLAQKSLRSFRQSGNEAGFLRASFALMLAESFALQFADCARTGTMAIPRLANSRYRWVQTQVLVQQGECLDALAQTEEGIRDMSKGVESAARSHYPSLELRAVAFAAARRSDLGAADRSLRDLLVGDSTFWNSDVTNARGETLYTVLSDFALARNWPHIEMFALSEILSDFPPADRVDLAVQEEILAGAQDRAGEHRAAKATLQHTAAEMTALPDDHAVLVRKAEISLELAKVQSSSGDAYGALSTLEQLRPQFEALDAGMFQASYFKTYGEAFLAAGDERDAEPLLERALSITERSLHGIPLEANRLAWSKTRGQIYRDLLQTKLHCTTPAEAFAWWEWYKSASLRTVSPHGRAPAKPEGDSLAAPRLPSRVLPAGTAVVSYAILENIATVFVFRDGLVTSRTLELSGDKKLRALRFLSLCADPAADLNALDAQSQRLYALLVAPLESELRGATKLFIETDGVLDLIPFGLLRDEDHRYLADRFDITYSPGLAYGLHANAATTISAASPALVVVAANDQESSLPPLPQGAEEGTDVAAFFHGANLVAGPNLTRASVLRDLRDAEEFHFVGHAVTGAEHVGLLLGPDSEVEAEDLAKVRPLRLRLAVLSACSTANGENGEFSDVDSIARTLAAAGVPSIIASRWNVDSVVTRDLMRAFYSNLISGKTAGESLHAASLAIRSLPGYQHPYYWGSFALFGSS